MRVKDGSGIASNITLRIQIFYYQFHDLWCVCIAINY